MNKKLLLPTLILALIFTMIIISSAAAAPKALSATFSIHANPCSIVWFTNRWKPVSIEGQGNLIQHPDGSFVMTCKFNLDFNNPKLLSREDFCSQDWAKFMCKADGALVDNRTTCNLEGVTVHNGTVVTGPSGEGTFVCNVK
jgi:hypothetical protein